MNYNQIKIKKQQTFKKCNNNKNFIKNIIYKN